MPGRLNFLFLGSQTYFHPIACQCTDCTHDLASNDQLSSLSSSFWEKRWFRYVGN